MNVGDKVTARNPYTGKRAPGTVAWISPTQRTMQIELDDGGYAYEFPDHEWGSGEMSEAAKRWYAQNGKTGFKGAVKRVEETP